MKTSIKIILLLVTLFVCVGAILIFQKTVVQPPLKMKLSDQYSNAMKERLDNFKQASPDSLEVSYFMILDFANRLADERKNSEKKYAENIGEIVTIYVPKFTKWCYSIFNGPSWNTSNLNFMTTRINELKNYKIDDMPLLSSRDEIELQHITDILNKYNAARQLAGSSAFTSVANAKDKIKRAREFASDQYLKHNNDLVKLLDALPSKIGQSHYNYVIAQINRMQNYSHYSPEDFERLVDNATEAIKEYQAVANLYGKSTDVTYMKTLQSDLYDKAYSYYDSDIAFAK